MLSWVPVSVVILILLNAISFADFEKTESKDILVKAQSFGMKLWSVESKSTLFTSSCGIS